MTMLDTVLSVALPPLFDRLLSLGKDLGEDLAKSLEKWESKLDWIKGVLVDAEHKQFESEAVKKWVDDLQDLAFDMEDVLEDFAIKLKDKQLQSKAANMVTKISNILSTVFNRTNQGIKKEMEELTRRLEEVKERTQILGLSASTIVHQPILQIEALRDQRETSSIVLKVFGRDDQKQNIIIQLLEGEQGDKNYALIPIVGMGGIGKTTLARYAYNHEKVQGFFDLKAWVCVSDLFNVKRITKAIFKAIAGGGTAVHFSTVEEAQTQLMQALTNRKFLIVLDDIWNEEDGPRVELQKPFEHATRGSRVIMTTRYQKIAKMMNTNPSDNNIINLEGLSGEDCWSVFLQHANNDLNLAELRVDIIKMCKGLPLAAKLLGGLLKNIVDIKRCRKILDSNPCGKESGALPVLRLSYHYLPSHLKRIFTYCSVLPKDYKFTKREVILLWMAQGFLPENEDLGDIYFNDLVSRSLFQQCRVDEWVILDNLLDGKMNSEERFIMHDLIHDLALWAAGKICYVMDTKDRVDWKRIRHVFLPEDARIILGSQLPKAQLRTFYCDDSMHFENLNFIRDFRYIRTLRLASATIEVLPDYIGELKHLRFLNLEFERVKQLPESISNLWNLQTLCLINFFRLKKVPNIGSLEKLRHLKILGTFLEEMPIGVEKLTNLQSLDYKFVYGARVSGSLVGGYPTIFDPTIFDLEYVLTIENASEAQLYKLYMRWETRRDEVDDNTRREVLEQLKPPSSMKECKLQGCGGLVLPAWLGDPCSIHSQKVCSSHLAKLIITRCPSLISFPEGMLLPALEELFIEKCANMESLPRDMQKYRNLKVLDISSCPKLQSFPEAVLPLNLKKLSIRGVLGIDKPIQEWGLHLLASLKVLHLRNVGRCINTAERIGGPDDPYLPPSLSVLKIEGFQNLKSISFSTLPNLRLLMIKLCPHFSSFEDNALPRRLKRVTIFKCDLIRPHLKRNRRGRIRMDLKRWSLR